MRIIFHPEVFLHHTLSNGDLSLRVYLPDKENGFYRSTRFDHSGLISHLEFSGNTYFQAWQDEEHNPYGGDHVLGIAGEFGRGDDNMPAPLGYDNAKVGESYLKIGVGELIRTDAEPYCFYNTHPIRNVLPWDVRIGENEIRFIQSSYEVQGYAYRYERTLRLTDDPIGFICEQHLENTGQNPIHQMYYAHNFININNDPVGLGHQLTFPFIWTAEDALGPLVTPTKNTLEFSKNVQKVIFSRLHGFSQQVSDHEFTFSHEKSHTSLRISGNTPMSRLYLFIKKGCICPEPFVDITLAPGESHSWLTTHSFINHPNYLQNI